MPLIRLTLHIHAPVERVFDLARSIDAHMAGSADTGERAVAGRTSGLIESGETVTWEAKHFGIRQKLTVRVTHFDRPREFADEMISGAFAFMNHRHSFEATGEGTRMTDEFFFASPCGIFGKIFDRLFLEGYMRRFLLLRARELKRVAESDEWRRYLTEERSVTRS